MSTGKALVARMGKASNAQVHPEKQAEALPLKRTLGPLERAEQLIPRPLLANMPGIWALGLVWGMGTVFNMGDGLFWVTNPCMDKGW